MIITFALHVAYDDGRTFEVTTNARDQVAFEQHFGLSVLELVPKSLLGKAAAQNGDGTIKVDGDDLAIRTDRFIWLAWQAMHRKGLEPGDFDVFCDQVADIRWDFARAVPTPPAPHIGS